MFNCRLAGKAPDLTNAPFNWRSSAMCPVGEQPYCPNCCDNDRLDFYFNETWNMICPTNTLGAGITTELKDYQFQFARFKNIADTGIVTCDLSRNYNMTLIGYKVAIQVVENNSGTSYWRSVTDCKAWAIERERKSEEVITLADVKMGPLFKVPEFTEQIIMTNIPWEKFLKSSSSSLSSPSLNLIFFVIVKFFLLNKIL